MSDSQKTAVIFGLANKRSIAWAIAKKLHEAGWRLAITYQNERLELEARDLIAEMAGAARFMCDGTKDDEIARLFEELKSRYGVLHGLGDSVGFSPPEELKNQVERAPLKRNVDAGEGGGTAAFLLSEAGSGITGETIFVDCGYNIMGF